MQQFRAVAAQQAYKGKGFDDMKGQRHISRREALSVIQDRKTTAGKLKAVKRDLWEKEFVRNHFEIPGKHQKYLSGRFRKRELQRRDREINGPPDTGELPRVGARKVIVDQEQQERRMAQLSHQIRRILEEHLAGTALPVRQLSPQFWQITDVLVSFNLKTAVCCYKVTAGKASEYEEGSQPHLVRRVIKESADYLNAVVNLELVRGAGRSIGTPKSINLKFARSSATSKLLEQMEAEVRQADQARSAE
ncbi:hypothetical protein GGF46_001208 [Coemansia sp. RSA 552]|nr:hypothetical protein GGF46_001208 [Coemansia sp. RSA 552]